MSCRLQGAPALSDAGRDHLDGGGARSLTVNTGRRSHMEADQGRDSNRRSALPDHRPITRKEDDKKKRLNNAGRADCLQQASG